MTQQQKQQERPKQALRPVGEIVIATLDLLLGLPVAGISLSLLSQSSGLDKVIYLTMALSGLAMLGAGLLLLLRLRTLGRLFQWLAAAGGWGLAVGIVVSQLSHPYKETAMLAILGGCILASLSLSLLPLWLRKLEEE